MVCLPRWDLSGYVAVWSFHSYFHSPAEVFPRMAGVL